MLYTMYHSKKIEPPPPALEEGLKDYKSIIYINICSRKCIENFYKLVRPGGIFIIDHRTVTDIFQSISIP